MASIVTIDDFWLSQVKKCVAYPDVDYILLDDDQIRDLCVFPALLRYYTKFPVLETVQYSIGANSEMSIPFPDDNTFGVKDARVTDMGMIGGSGSAFWETILWQTQASSYIKNAGGAYNIPGYNPGGLMQQRDLQRMAYKSYQNEWSTVRYRVDEPNKQFVAFSSVAGLINVTWAKKYNDFSKVKTVQQLNVIDLASCYLLRHLSDAASIISDTALEVTINSEALKTRADEIEQKVMEIWNAYQDIILIHAT